ncbi:MAG: GntR family transcriptional regulator [Beijerinckiaceae bacterium]
MTKTPLPHRTLSAAIIDRLRQDIFEGRHAAGAQLRQDALADAYGVSRIPVREALFQLEAEGLVRMLPHKGAVVTGLSRAEIDDVFDLRVLLEARLFAASAPALTDQDLTQLDSTQTAFSQAMASGDRARWGEHNAAFHASLYARANLPRTQSIVTALLQTSDRYTRIQLATPQAWQRAEREHREIIRLCRGKEFAAGHALLVAHIQQVRDDLVTLLRE